MRFFFNSQDSYIDLITRASILFLTHFLTQGILLLYAEKLLDAKYE